MTTHHLLTATGLTKSFGAEDALRGVDLAVAPGESVAIMGPSGSGKSTLLNCLAGIIRPDGGTVCFDGADVTAMSDAARSRLRLRAFGFVFQDGQLIPELPARENVALPLRLTGAGRRGALRRADTILDQLGVGDQAMKLPGDMSGGQAQRVAVARAIAGVPRVIFADEPTGALDQPTGQEVMQLLTTLARMNDSALVMVTHDATVANWCSRLVEIRDGRIHADRALDGGAGR